MAPPGPETGAGGAILLLESPGTPEDGSPGQRRHHPEHHAGDDRRDPAVVERLAKSLLRGLDVDRRFLPYGDPSEINLRSQ
jgi:hypothetical protein